MAYSYTPSKPISIRDAGFDEKWLQEQIHADPSILGLGETIVIEKERSQVSGGRLDFLLWEPNEEIHYVVEVMLGPLDPSHLVRTIEYWDIESRRYPNREHRAVIIAESITTRFLNVISLLHRSIPLIAIQLNSFTAGSNLFVNFTRILDFTQPLEDEDPSGGTQKGKDYWSKVNPSFIEISDRILSLIPESRATYNQSHIAVGTSGNNFTWFHPRKRANLYWEFELNPEVRDFYLDKLEKAGFIPNSRGNEIIGLLVDLGSIQKNEALFSEMLKEAEVYSKI